MFRGLPLRALRAALVTLLIAFVVMPIVALPYTADDLANRNWAQPAISDAIREAWRLQKSWMSEQGRFFPGGSVYGLVIWNAFDSRVAYMTYLALLNIALVFLVAFVCWKLLRSVHLAAFAAVVMAACMQLRFGYLDGVASFGGLVPFTIVFTLAAGLLAGHILRGGSRWWALVAATLWVLAVTSYELSLLMLPAVLVVLAVSGPPLRERRLWAWATLPLLVPALLEFGVTSLLRSGDIHPAVAYQIDMSGPLGATFGKQFTAALPFTQMIAGAPLDGGLVVLLVVLVALPAFLVWRPWRCATSVAGLRVSVGLIVAGVWAWLVPSALASITTRWQVELIWGQGYVYLAYEWVGLTLLLTGVAALIRTRLPSPWARLVFGVLFGLGLLLLAGTAAMNVTVTGMTVPGPAGPG